MKKRLLPVLLLSAVLLTACGQASALLEPIASEEISQEFGQALRDQWDAWNRLSRQSQMLSSRTPGYCRRDFDSWAEWEAFLGLEVPNPLEDGPAEIVSDSSERYYANRTVLAQGRVLYRLDAIGESDAREQVEDAMGRALAAFSPEGDAASGV